MRRPAVLKDGRRRERSEPIDALLARQKGPPFARQPLTRALMAAGGLAGPSPTKPAVLFPPAVLKDGAAGPQPCGPKAGLEAGPSGRAAIN